MLSTSPVKMFVPFKVKKSNTITIAFQKVLAESGCKPNKMKPWLQDNEMEIYSTYNLKNIR